MVRWALSIALLGSVVTLVFAWVELGPLSIDEVTYHRMTHDLLAGHGFFISNGYEELNSPELASIFIRSTDEGRLAAQYPYGAPLLAAPLYALFGVRGMFLLNALAFVLAVWLCHRIAMQLVRDRIVALGAAALLCATYFSEYALAMWPHATAVAAILGAFSAAVGAYQAHDRPRRALVLAGVAGLIAGLGTTLRLDTLFCLPALAAPFFFAAPTRVGPLAALAAGFVPGIAFIIATNYIRWGALSPVSYGPKAPPLGLFIAFGIVGLVVTGGLWVASRPRSRAWLRARSRPLVVGGLFVVLAALIVPAIHTAVVRVLRGLIAIVVDLRAREPDGVTVVGTSAVMYIDEFKRSLLQSCPFLVLAVLPFVRRDRDLGRLGWLAVMPTILIGFFGAFAWHGGLALNMRYLLPALPFLCILVAIGVRQLARDVSNRWLIAGLVALSTTAIMYFVVWPVDFGPREQFVLTAPLVLVALTSVSVWLWSTRQRAAGPALVLVAVAIGWSVAATTQDTRWSRTRRAWHYQLTQAVAAHVPAGALLFAEFPDPFYGVIELRDRVRIAVPFYDNGETAAALVRDARANRRGIYAVLVPHAWQTLQEKGALKDTTLRPLGQLGQYVFAEIQPQ